MTQLNLHPRPFSYTDADYQALIAIDQQAWPGEPLSKEALQHDDRAWNPQHFSRA